MEMPMEYDAVEPPYVAVPCVLRGRVAAFRGLRDVNR